MTARKLFALAGAMVVVLSVLGPGVAAAASSGNQDAGNLSVGVTQDDDDVTVSVTYNGSAASGANVTVSDGSYAGTGDYVADDDGEVELPAPENNTTITVTASYEGDTASTTAELTAVDDDGNASDAFGQQVSAFVHELLENGTDDNETVGQAVSEFVTENNPGQGPPDHAGPPDDGERGPPEEKGNNGNGGDKPEHAGNDGENGNNGGNNGNGGGPPADKGPNKDED